MNTGLLLLLAVAIALTSCGTASSPPVSTPTPLQGSSLTPIGIPDLTAASEKEWHENVGKTVTVRGKFASWGLIGPVIEVGERTFNLEPKGNYSWGKEYNRMEGKEIRVTGTWGFRHFEPSSAQHPPDYFFIEVETARIELVK